MRSGPFMGRDTPVKPFLGLDPSHQCSNRPNGQTVPRLAVWTVGAMGGDALNGGATPVWRRPQSIGQPLVPCPNDDHQ